MKKNIFLSLLPFCLFCLIGTLVLSSFTFYQSSGGSGGIVVQRASAHDMFWHVALMESLNHGVPPANPLITGEKLQGYHYLNDLLWVGVHRLTGISFLRLYLHVAPLTLALLFSASTLILFLSLFRQKVTAYFGAAFIIFGANFAYIVPLFFRNSLGEQSAFWLDQSVAFGINQQLLLSLSIVNLIFYLFFKDRQKNWKVIGVLIGVLTGIKIYAAILLIPALLIIGVVEIWCPKKERNWRTLFAVLLASIIAAPLLLLVGNKNGFPFIWLPGWFLKTMFESGDRLNFSRWEMMRVNASTHGNWFRTFVLWLIAGIIFFVGNFGIKIFGILQFPIIFRQLQLRKKINYFQLLLTLLLLESFMIPLFWAQKGVVWNTVQFLSYAFVPLTILLVYFIQEHIPQRKWQVSLLVGLLILSLPTTVQTIYLNLQRERYMTIPPQLVEGISSLRNNYLDKELIVGDINHLYIYSLVPALSGRQVYWADEVILTILGDQHPERKQFIFGLETGKANCAANQVLLELSKEQQLVVLPCPLVVPPTPEVVPNL